MSRLAGLAQAINDRTNPVVVKELRQAVQSRLVVALLLLFLLANVLGTCLYLSWTPDLQVSERGGRTLFSSLFSLLVATCMIFVPLYAAVRLTMERNHSNIDLLFITTIAPGAIIRGKFWAAAALTALIYSACMPFLTFTYLLRGIDLPSIFFALGTAFLATLLVTMMAIFVGSVAGGMLLRMLMGGGLLFAGFWMMVYAITAGVTTVEMGITFFFSESEAWLFVGLNLLVGATVWGLFYLLSVAAVSARSSNRLFPVRVFLTACWLVYGVILSISSWVYTSYEPMTVWVNTSIVFFSIILALVLGERESWSPRVRRHIPRGFLGRFLAWIFYTGSAGGVVWCCLFTAITVLIGSAVVNQLIPGVSDTDEFYQWIVNFLHLFLFTWCYGMTGLFLRRLLFPNSPPLLSTVIGLVLVGLASVLPFIAASFLLGPHHRIEFLPLSFVIFNPFALAVASDGQYDRGTILAFLLIWSALGLLVNIPWFRRQWQAFRRYETHPIPAPALPAEEPVVSHA